MDLSGKETREKIIDPWLKSEDWRDEYIKTEVNSIKSDFRIRKYEIKKEEHEERMKKLKEIGLIK